ncbi:hypothetical protein Y032_0005g2550 [Ancylostoma ceylanicum]|uniref:Uncharacterized protein n=1 Tax=Ancylostoma ceylanicum TaxID=53326 RepID=A0A016VU28_9BILA|nr:hypothetical protein Y032_0005g2550 [Ancylostoma ceylanicum]
MWIQTSAAARQSWPGISRERRLYRSRSASESECVTPRRGNGDHLAVWSSLNSQFRRHTLIIPRRERKAIPAGSRAFFTVASIGSCPM